MKSYDVTKVYTLFIRLSLDISESLEALLFYWKLSTSPPISGKRRRGQINFWVRYDKSMDGESGIQTEDV